MGHEAWQMIGRTPGYIVAVRPLRQGAITDFDITQRMIRLLLHRVGVNRFNRPRVVICVPSAITEVERRAVTEAARRAGAADAQLIEQPMAAAIGAGLPIHEPVGNMVVDVGGGTSETALISLGGVVALKAVRVGSFDIDAAIQTVHPPRVRHRRRRAHRGGDQDRHRLGVADARRGQGRGAGPRPHERPAQDVILSPEEVREAIDEPCRRHRRLGRRLPRRGAARAGPGPHPQRHAPRRRRRHARAASTSASPTRPRSPCTSSTPRSSASCSAPAAASRPTTASRSCSWGQPLGRPPQRGAGPRRPGAPAGRGPAPAARGRPRPRARRRPPGRAPPAAARWRCPRWPRGSPAGRPRRRGAEGGDRGLPDQRRRGDRRPAARAATAPGGAGCELAQRRRRPPRPRPASSSPSSAQRASATDVDAAAWRGLLGGPAPHAGVRVGQRARRGRRPSAAPSRTRAPRAVRPDAGVGVVQGRPGARRRRRRGRRGRRPGGGRRASGSRNTSGLSDGQPQPTDARSSTSRAARPAPMPTSRPAARHDRRQHRCGQPSAATGPQPDRRWRLARTSGPGRRSVPEPWRCPLRSRRLVDGPVVRARLGRRRFVAGSSVLAAIEVTTPMHAPTTTTTTTTVAHCARQRTRTRRRPRRRPRRPAGCWIALAVVGGLLVIAVVAAAFVRYAVLRVRARQRHAPPRRAGRWSAVPPTYEPDGEMLFLTVSVAAT